MQKKKKKSTKGKTVKKHPDIRYIDNMLLSGWSPRRVHEWLMDNNKQVFSAQTIQNYRDNFLDIKMILPASTFEKKLKSLNVSVDALRDLYNLIELPKIRLAPLLESEEVYKKTHPDTHKELTLLRDTIVRTIQLEMELGIREKAAIEIHDKKFDMADMLKTFLMEKALREKEEQKALESVIVK